MRTRIEFPAKFDLGGSLGFLVGQLSKRMTGEFNTKLSAHALTTGQWAVLACLWHEDGLTQSELSKRTGIDAATLTEMLKRMSRRGLVRRMRDERNNRYQRVYLTRYDTALRDELTAMATSVNARAVHGFSATERIVFADLLTRATVNMAYASSADNESASGEENHP